MKLEKFDLEKALNGAKVVTRDGREVSQLAKFECVDEYPIVGVLDSFICVWTIKGEFEYGDKCDEDLFLESKVRRAWLNVYGNGRDILTSGCYRTKQVALNNISEDYEYIKTIEITDEL